MKSELEKPLWGVYDYSEKEKHIARVDEQHSFDVSCDCWPRIDVGEDYILVIHEARQ